jgi:adenylate cyclase
MINRLIIFAFIIICSLSGHASTFPDSLLFKSFNIQCLGVNAMKGALLDNDTSVTKQKLHELQSWAGSKGDQQLKYLFLLFEYSQSTVKHYFVNDLELHLLELISEFEKKNMNFLRAKAYQVLGEYYWETQNRTAALEKLMHAYKMYTNYSITEFPDKAEFLSDIGGKFYFFRDFKAAKKYFMECLSLVPEKLVENRTSKLNTVAMCYRLLEQYDSALHYYDKANQIALGKKDSVWIGIIAGNVAWTLYYQKQYDKALPMFEQNIEYDLKYREYMDAAFSMSALIQILILKNQPQRAMELARRAHALMISERKINDFNSRKTIFPSIAKAYFANGDAKTAFIFMDSAAIAIDSFYKQRSALILTGVQHKLEMEDHLLELQRKEAEISRQRLLRNSFISGFVLMLLFAGVFFYQRNKISKERQRSERLLLNILPFETAAELKETGHAVAKSFDQVTIMFTDFKDFTIASEHLSARELVEEINYFYSHFDTIVTKYGIEKIKTIGDSYMCASGLPTPSEKHAIDMVNAALEIRDFIAAEKKQRLVENRPYFEIRIGLHSGPVVAGIVGINKFAYDIWGDSVNIASRMESSGEVDRVNISGATYELVKDIFSCTNRGKIQAKNKGEVEMYFVERRS